MRTQQKIAKVLELSKLILPVKDYELIEKYMSLQRYNSVRHYVEDQVYKAERLVLSSIVDDKFDEVYATRYKNFKRLDNEITFLCELI